MIWLIIGIVTLVFLIVCLASVWFVHHRDHKAEESWRSKYMAERMEQIANKHTELDRRHSVHEVHRKHFDDLKEAIALHPDFAEGGRYTRGQTIVAKPRGMEAFEGHQGARDELEMPDLMPKAPEVEATATSKKQLI